MNTSERAQIHANTRNFAIQRFSLHGVDLTKFDGGGACDQEVIPSIPQAGASREITLHEITVMVLSKIMHDARPRRVGWGQPAIQTMPVAAGDGRQGGGLVAGRSRRETRCRETLSWHARHLLRIPRTLSYSVALFLDMFLSLSPPTSR